MEIFPGITVEANKCGGKPCIRGFRITVEHVLRMMSSGMTPDQIVQEWNFLTQDDIRAALLYGAHLAAERTIAVAT